MSVLYMIIQQTMFFAIPLLIVALGEMFTERGGVDVYKRQLKWS